MYVLLLLFNGNSDHIIIKN